MLYGWDAGIRLCLVVGEGLSRIVELCRERDVQYINTLQTRLHNADVTHNVGN
jgi:hypothetical protein